MDRRVKIYVWVNSQSKKFENYQRQIVLFQKVVYWWKDFFKNSILSIFRVPWVPGYVFNYGGCQWPPRSAKGVYVTLYMLPSTPKTLSHSFAGRYTLTDRNICQAHHESSVIKWSSIGILKSYKRVNLFADVFKATTMIVTATCKYYACQPVSRSG